MVTFFAGEMNYSRAVITTIAGALLVIALGILLSIYFIIPNFSSLLSKESISNADALESHDPLVLVNSTTTVPKSSEPPFHNGTLILDIKAPDMPTIWLIYGKYKRPIDAACLFFVVFLFGHLVFWRFFIGVMLYFAILRASLLLLWFTRRLIRLEDSFVALKKKNRKDKQAFVKLKKDLSGLSQSAFGIFSIIYALGLNFHNSSTYFYMWSHGVKNSINYIFNSVMTQELKIRSLRGELDALTK